MKRNSRWKEWGKEPADPAAQRFGCLPADFDAAGTGQRSSRVFYTGRKQWRRCDQCDLDSGSQTVPYGGKYRERSLRSTVRSGGDR